MGDHSDVINSLVSAGLPAPVAEALTKSLSLLVEAAVSRAFSTQLSEVTAVVSMSEATIMAQLEAVLVNQEMQAERPAAPARATSAAPRLNIWFAKQFVSPEFRERFAAAIPEGAEGKGSAADWRSIGRKVYSAISKEPQHAPLLELARRLLQAENDANADGPLPTPGDEVASPAPSAGAPEIPADDDDDEPPAAKPKKSAKPAAKKATKLKK